jgi:hypothetical protein
VRFAEEMMGDGVRGARVVEKPMIEYKVRA